MKQEINKSKRKGKELSYSQPSDVDESRSPFHRPRGHFGSFRPKDITVFVIVAATAPMESRLFSDPCVLFAEHLSIGLIVFIEASRATGVLAEEVFWVVFGTRVCYRTWSFDRLSARRGST